MFSPALCEWRGKAHGALMHNTLCLEQLEESSGPLEWVVRPIRDMTTRHVVSPRVAHGGLPFSGSHSRTTPTGVTPTWRFTSLRAGHDEGQAGVTQGRPQQSWVTPWAR